MYQKLIEALPTSTDLYYVDRNDEMPIKALGSIVKHNGEDEAFEEMDQILYDWDTSYSVDNYIDGVLSDVSKAQSITVTELKDILDEQMIDWRDELRYVIQDRDTSIPFKDLARNKGNVIVKLIMYSGFDCINSDWCEGNQLDLDESYLADVLRVMRINPLEYERVIPESYECDNVEDVFRGEPLIEPIDVFNEHQNLSIGPALFTIVFSLPAEQIIDHYSGLVKVPAGARVGFYGEFGGSGSIFDARLLDDFVVDLKNQRKDYSVPIWSLEVDGIDENHSGTYGNYSLRQIYDRYDSHWDVEGEVMVRNSEPLPFAA